MTKLIALSLFFLFLLTTTCSNSKNCKDPGVEKLYTISLENNGLKSYQHIVIMPGFKRDCMDSTVFLKSVNNYLQSINDEKPVSSVEIFNSKNGYDPGETLSQSSEFYKNCLVTIWLDISTGEPYKFYFYRSNGEVQYEGPFWKP